MLVAMNEILQNAFKEGYGIAAPNVFNLETVEGAFECAAEMRSPLVIDCAERFDLEAVAALVKIFAERFSQVPVALNLDHGKTYTSAVKAIRVGFTSVMVDRSQAVFEENLRETKEIVKMAHAVGVSVEAELGHVGQGTDYQNSNTDAFTQVDDAVRFVRETEVDCLAVAIGTAHGRYAGTPKIDFHRLTEIRRNVAVPLVLHGGSSTGDENLAKAVHLGITKVNLATDLFSAGINKMQEYLANEEFPAGPIVARKYEQGYKNALRHYMALFGSGDRI
ncbi:MAG: class II fructose-bisphosphate aldolase [Negativicutes bacterium]|nr:class II fructose-bisphosphate aldolase [Negativicutes bacterium]